MGLSPNRRNLMLFLCRRCQNSVELPDTLLVSENYLLELGSLHTDTHTLIAVGFGNLIYPCKSHNQVFTIEITSLAYKLHGFLSHILVG